MKIAVCFSGQFRTAKECTPNLKRYFSSDLHEIDFFIHTWDNTSYKNFNGTNIYPQQDRFITNDEINFLKEVYNPKAIKVESHSNYLKRFVENGFGNGLELWYSFYKSITLKKWYERKYGFKYDIVFKIRPDCMFRLFNLNNEINNIIQYPSNTLASHFKYDENWKNILTQISANDICFISNSKVMDEYAAFFVDKRTYDKKYNPMKCNNGGYGYTQFMHTHYKKLETTNMLIEPFVLRDAYKYLAKGALSDDTLNKIEELDGFYYTYYKTEPDRKLYIHTLLNQYNHNLDNFEKKIYLNED